MTISKDLFLAILSMDAYNRGYGPGIGGLGGKDSKIGSATLKTDSEAVFRLPGQAPDTLSPAATAGFYAVAYTMGADAPQGLAGKTVISYRGTDNMGRLSDPIKGGSDILQGWIAGIGDGVRQSGVGLMAGVERGI